MTPEPIRPLPSDPKRQADPLFRGCEFQLWQTVNAWLRLGSDELLFIEGAEDFDVVGPESGTATQVKNSERPLRSFPIGRDSLHQPQVYASGAGPPGPGKISSSRFKTS